MSDNATAGSEASGEQGNIAEQGGADVGATTRLDTLSSPEDKAPAGAETPDEADWRVDDAAGDERVLRELKRYKSRANVARALVETKARVSAGIAPPKLPENATEEQVAEYRKAIGIPETPDGYGVKWRDDFKPTPEQNAMLEAWVAHAHAKNMQPGDVNEAVEFVQQWHDRQTQEYTNQLRRQIVQVDNELASEYGPDYERNIGVLKEHYLSLRPALRELVLNNLHNKSLIREVMSDALDMSPPGAMLEGDSAGGGRSLDEQINDLTTKSLRGPLTESEDRRLNQLHGERIRRNEKRANAA